MGAFFKKINASILIILWLFFTVSVTHSNETDSALYAAAETAVADEADGTTFFNRSLARKYNLLEEDFHDVPHRPGKFDYLKETLEDLRHYSRPDGDEFAILNLEWKDGAVFLNDFETAPGTAKKRRGFFKDDPKRLFYRLFADQDRLVHQETFEIPTRLHYDFLDAETDALSGGAIDRTELDFVLKIPVRDKTAQKIIFYRQKDLAGHKLRQKKYDELHEQEEITIIGETLF